MSQMPVSTRSLYPVPERPLRSGYLPVSPPHRIYWEEYGNPQGEPVLFLHGGPGGGSTPIHAGFFNPDRYRVILFDQRGCGKSEPNAADPDPLPALAYNTTPHLIGDIVALRAALSIHGPMHLFGGSWGSTLAIAYAIAHPATVANLILRGVFLCRAVDLDYFYQGNAAAFASDPQAVTGPGAYLTYPEPWAHYVSAIPPDARGDMIKAYAARFALPAADAQEVNDAAIAWSLWEGVTSNLVFNAETAARFSDPTFARAFARIENHYFLNGAFLGGTGEANRAQNYILEHVARIASIPVHIVHGRYDQVCPLFQAEALREALLAAGGTLTAYHVTTAGHSMMEPETRSALVAVMDTLLPLAFKKKFHN